MSWWTENRKKVALLGGLLAAPWVLPALGGLLGIGGAAAGAGAAGAGAAGAGAAGAAGAASAVPAMAAMAGPEVAALAGGSLAPSMLSKAAAFGGKAMTGLGTASKVLGATQGLLGPSGPPTRPPVAPPPQPSGPMPLMGSSYGGGDMPPPGVDPNQWAQMTPEQKAALKAQRGMA